MDHHFQSHTVYSPEYEHSDCLSPSGYPSTTADPTYASPLTLSTSRRTHVPTPPAALNLWSGLKVLAPDLLCCCELHCCSGLRKLFICLLSRGVKAWDRVRGAEGRTWRLFHHGHLSVQQRNSAHLLLSLQQHAAAGQCDHWRQTRHLQGPAGFEPAVHLACLSGQQWKPECVQWEDYSKSR